MLHPHYPDHEFMLFSREDTIRVEALLASVQHDQKEGVVRSYATTLDTTSDVGLCDVVGALQELDTNEERVAFLSKISKKYTGALPHLQENTKRVANNVLWTLGMRKGWEREKQSLHTSPLQSILEEWTVLAVTGDALVIQLPNTLDDSQIDTIMSDLHDIYPQVLVIAERNTRYTYIYLGRFRKHVWHKFPGSGWGGVDEGITVYHKHSYASSDMITFLEQLQKREASDRPEDKQALDRYEKFRYRITDHEIDAIIDDVQKVSHPQLQADVAQKCAAVKQMVAQRNERLVQNEAAQRAVASQKQILIAQGIMNEEEKYIPKWNLQEQKENRALYDACATQETRSDEYAEKVDRIGEVIQNVLRRLQKYKHYDVLLAMWYTDIIQADGQHIWDKRNEYNYRYVKDWFRIVVHEPIHAWIVDDAELDGYQRNDLINSWAFTMIKPVEKKTLSALEQQKLSA